MTRNKYSNHKIFSFPEKVQSFRDGTITPPLYVRVKPTNRCNHGCHWCVYSDGTKRPRDRAGRHLQSFMHDAMNERDEISESKMVEILGDFSDIGVRAVTYSGGGEPLIHPKIVLIMSRTVSLGIDLSIITNGQTLNGDRAMVLKEAKWVRVSIDYTNAEQMAESRNVPLSAFDAVMKNIKDFSGMKPDSCDLGVNFIVTAANHNYLSPFASFLKSIGVQNIRFSPVYTAGFHKYHEPLVVSVKEQLREIQSICDERFSVNSSYDIDSPTKKPSRPFTRCLYSQTVPVIGADQCVYACTDTAYTEHGRLGSLEGISFKDFWGSPQHQEVWNRLNPSRVCNHECKAHDKIVIFEELAAASHDNFV